MKHPNILPANEVHIWSASLLDHRKNLDYLKSILSQDEYKQAEKFKFYKDKHNYTIARGVLRCLLSLYLGEAPQSVEFVYGLWGKPGLLGEPPLYFNVSHSGDYALYAFTRHYEVGIDLEYINENIEIEEIISTILSPFEKAQLDATSLDERIQVFFRLWTCKEAYLKAIGRGWLEDKAEDYFGSVKLFEKVFERASLYTNPITYPYCFESIPEYAGALFVKGPPLLVVQIGRAHV